jgi:hypothetical protein
MCPHQSSPNLTQFSMHSALGQLIQQAKIYNKINAEFCQKLPEVLKTLELCVIKNGVATLISSNPAVAFRAKQQLDEITTILQSVALDIAINRVEIKVSVDKIKQ